MVLIPPHQTITFTDIAAQLQAHLAKRNPAAQCSLEGAKITILLDGEYRLRIYWETAPHVLVESQELAAKFEHPQKAIMATCDRRLTTVGDADPNMNYFNDYVYVLEVLEDLPHVFVYDPLSGELR
jgi:hypothetical protein